MREVIVWPIRVWLSILALDIAVALSVGVALTNLQLSLFFLLLLIATLTFWWRTRLIIQIDQAKLRVGQASLDLPLIKEVITLDEEQMRRERSSALNPRAFLALRFWIKVGVKVILDDPRDPTPYWLISTRKGELISAQCGSRG